MLDRFRSMEVFVAAVDAGSFAAAAERLGMSAQMVARHVQALEQRLGATLLQRTTRRQSLTELGSQYHERCVVVLSEAAAADALALEAKAEPHGQLRVSAPQEFGAQSLVDFALLFMARYPRVAVDLRLSDQRVNLLDDGVEAAFRIGEPAVGESSSLVTRPLRRYRMVACAAPAYLERAGMPRQPADLAAHQCIGFVFWNRKVFNEWVFTQGGQDYPVRIEGRLQVNSSQAQLRAALAGGGILLGAEDLVRADLEAGRLVRVLPGYEGPSRPMHLIYVADRQRTAKLRCFVEEAVQAFAGR
ncbi:MAG: LysR family transcriptional regulator [Comamonas sp.]